MTRAWNKEDDHQTIGFEFPELLGTVFMFVDCELVSYGQQEFLQPGQPYLHVLCLCYILIL